MIKFLTFLAVVALALPIGAALAAPTRIDGMYVNRFGNPKNPALIFIHGGPGFNSANFEFTTAPVLAEQGFHVVVYDQRGQGRSDEAPSSQFNYKQYAKDLKTIIDELHLLKPALLGHSHGGPIAIRFDELYPGVAGAIVLLAAPIYFWDSMRSIFGNCAYRYELAGAPDKLAALANVYQRLFLGPQLNPEQLTDAVAASFNFAGDCGLYYSSRPTPESQALYAQLMASPPVQNPTGEMTATPGFLFNENYIHFDGSAHVRAQQSRFCAIYGSDDGLFSPLTRAVIQGLVPRYTLIPGASHSIFIDQQSLFIHALKETCSLKPVAGT